MSVTALRGTPSRLGPRVAQAALALAAFGSVAGAVALLVWLFVPAAPPPTRNPFGMGLREAAPSATAFGRLLLGLQSQLSLALRHALGAVRDDPLAILSLAGLGFAYGVFHAAGPGHGKAVISAYIVSSERALRRGLALSAAAALVQALVAIGLVGAVFVAAGGTAATLTRTANAVELAGFALVAALGAALTWRGAGRLLVQVTAARRGRAPASCACEADHLPPPDRLERVARWRDLATIALGAGIRPCSGAILILVLALSQKLFWAGVAATFAMAAGTALTTATFAILAVYAKRAALRLAGGRGWAGAIVVGVLELAGAAFVLTLGLSLLTGLGAGEGGF